MMAQLTAFQRDVLHVIRGQDQPKGLEIKSELEKVYSSEVNHGQLYPNLDTLSSMGLVEKSKKDNRANKYTLTQKGHEALNKREAWTRKYKKRNKKRRDSRNPAERTARKITSVGD